MQEAPHKVRGLLGFSSPAGAGSCGCYLPTVTFLATGFLATTVFLATTLVTVLTTGALTVAVLAAVSVRAVTTVC